MTSYLQSPHVPRGGRVNVHSPNAIPTATVLHHTPSASRTRGSLLQRKCTGGGAPGPTGECEECSKRRLQCQGQGVATGIRKAFAVPHSVHEVLHSPGQPLDAVTRAFMEQRFAHDFSQVRVHTGLSAATSARAVDALAYTVGRNIVFGSGQYSPESVAGRRLLAHELTHVLQQGAAAQATETGLETSEANSSAEQEANAVSSALERDWPLEVTAPSFVTLARQADAGIPDDARRAQVECVKRLGGCANTRPGGIPSEQEIAQYNEQCREETGYTGPDVTPTDEECRGITPATPVATPTSVFLCSKDLETSPLGTHAFFRVGGSGPGHPTFGLEPEDRGSDCYRGQPKRDFPADVNAAAQCEMTSLALSCIEAQFAAYPVGHYCALGPNSNTFVGHVARRCGMSNPDPAGWNPGIDDSPPPPGTFAASPMTTLVLGCRTKTCS
jgi:Domain of unknown function (DUF4157)